MKRKRAWVLAVCIALGLCYASGAGASPELNERLFSRAKQAVSLMSYGEYDEAIQKLKLDVEADELEQFVCDELSDVFSATIQQEVGVAYWDGSQWTVAVPIKEPTDGSVQTFYIISEDGESASGYGAMSWSEVEDALVDCESLIWKNEYAPGVPVLVPDRAAEEKG